MTSNYEKQANDFIVKVGATMETKLLGNMPYFDDDKESRDVYLITLTRGKKVYSFRFGQSLVNSGNKVKPTAYDVLACVQKSDIGTFEDFCGDFGYDTDSRKAEKMYFAVQKEFREVDKLFHDVMAELQEIN